MHELNTGRLEKLCIAQRSLVFGLLTTLALSGCAAAKLYREGRAEDEAGREYRAAQFYLKALGENEKHKKAREALVAVAEHAYKEKLALAESAERTDNFPKALTEYRAVGELLSRLGEWDAAEFEVIDTRRKVDEMENASAEQQYRGGEEKLAAQAWEEAIRFYTAALSFKSGYKNSAEKIGLAYYSWGEDELASNQYRAAAGHFYASTESAGPAYKDAAHRAGAIYASLGKHFLTVDRCRQAAKDLRMAAKLLGNGAVNGDVAAAEECAVTAVAVLAFENPTGTNLAGMALGATLADETAARVRGGASEFVRLMERTALDSILTEQGLSAAGVASGTASKLRGVRYLVIGRLTQVKVETPAVQREAKSVSGTAPFECTKTRSDGSRYTGTCFNAVTVRYEERTARIALRVAGNVRIVDVRSGEQLATVPLEASYTDSVHFADDFTVNGTGVGSLTLREHTDGIGVDGDLYRLATKERQELKTEEELTRDAIDKLSRESAQAVLAAVDTERPAVDPPSLTVARSR